MNKFLLLLILPYITFQSFCQLSYNIPPKGKGFFIGQSKDVIINQHIIDSQICLYRLFLNGDTVIYYINNTSYKEPIKIFKFYKDTCVSYTVIFNKQSYMFCYIESLPGKFHIQRNDFFKNKTPEELEKIFLSRHPGEPLTTQEKKIIEDRKESMKEEVNRVEDNYVFKEELVVLKKIQIEQGLLVEDLKVNTVENNNKVIRLSKNLDGRVVYFVEKNKMSKRIYKKNEKNKKY